MCATPFRRVQAPRGKGPCGSELGAMVSWVLSKIDFKLTNIRLNNFLREGS